MTKGRWTSLTYYDANAVAYESAAARYTDMEPLTFCDCGEVAEPGDVYCKTCKENMHTALNLAIDFLEKHNAVDRETAISQLIWAIEEE